MLISRPHREPGMLYTLVFFFPLCSDTTCPLLLFLYLLHYAVNKTSVVVILFIAHLCSLFLMMVWVAVCLCLVFYSLYRCGLDISYPSSDLAELQT
jgi:hypothetical protein